MSTIFLRLNGLPSPEPVRVPLLERCIARAGESRLDPDWRSGAFALVAAPGARQPGVAAAALCAAQGASDAPAVFMATPVHCEAGMVSVRLPLDGIVRLEPAAAARLAADFNAEFATSGARLLAGAQGQLYCLLAHSAAVPTHDPLQVCGRDIGEYLPQGAAGAPLRRLMAEIEMWLHGREAAPITGLWLWGGGESGGSLPALAGWTAGDDPLFGAWPKSARLPAQPGNGVVVVDAEPGREAWTVAQETWLRPAVAGLRRGRFTALLLSIGERRYRLGRWDLLRVWRRSRPWWESLA